LNDVRAFVRVVDKGSVSAAARDLHITQSAVTKRLQRLESFLGAKLFDRTQRPVGLTAAGRSAVEKCRRPLNYELQLLLASQARGLTLAPERILQASRLRPRPQMLRVAGLHFPFTIWSVHHRSAELEPLFERLNALVAAALAKRMPRS
jgi:DNA-binding transcriptional LysR family regulator